MFGEDTCHPAALDRMLDSVRGVSIQGFFCEDAMAVQTFFLRPPNGIGNQNEILEEQERLRRRGQFIRRSEISGLESYYLLPTGPRA